MHVGAVTLLAHWHYFKRCDLMAVNWDDVAGEPALGGLTRAQLGFVRDVVERVRARRTYFPTFLVAPPLFFGVGEVGGRG